MLVQPDGKILVAGHATDANGFQHLTVWRLTDQGALDTSFDSDGYFSDPVGLAGLSLHETRVGLVLDSSGRIYLAGTRYTSGSGYDFSVWRLLPNGTPDATLKAGDGDGVFTHHNAAGGQGRDMGLGAILDSAGHLLVTGHSRSSRPTTKTQLSGAFNETLSSH